MVASSAMTVEVHTGADRDMPEVAVAPGARVLVSQVVGGNGMPDTMGVGFTRYEGEWDYHLNYDVTYYMLEGTLTIVSGGESHTAGPGDIVYMIRGTDLRYDATAGGCTLFWVAIPGNWEEITDLPGR
jgi:ethanolamine utilization protein EutQ (cupin superfamily)